MSCNEQEIPAEIGSSNNVAKQVGEDDKEPSNADPSALPVSEKLPDNGDDFKENIMETLYDPPIVSVITSLSSGSSENSMVLLKTASSLQCPFAWRMDLPIKKYGDHDNDLLSDFEELFEESRFRIRKFVRHLIQCYHTYFRRLLEDSMKHLECLEQMLCFSTKRDCGDILFNTINDGLFHIVLSMRFYILALTDKNSAALQILSKIKPYNCLSDANKAGIWGIRASVHAEYDYEGVKAALTYIEKAIEIDPNNADWHFMKGTYLGRQRRMEKVASPSAEEIIALERAVKRGDAEFIAFTAEAYMENARCSIKLYEKIENVDEKTLEILRKEVEKLHIKAAELFVKSVTLRPTSAHLLFRCGKGLVKLPEPHQDLELAAMYLRRGLKINPNSSFGNHAFAMYEQKCNKNINSAKQYLKHATEHKNFQAQIDLIRLNFIEDDDGIKLIFDLMKALDLYTEIPKRCRILGELVCCYVFVKYKLTEACLFMKDLIQNRSDWIQFDQEFKSYVLPFSKPVLLIETICNEIKRQFSKEDVSDQNKDIYKDFLHFLCLENICLPRDHPGIRKMYLEDMKRGLVKQRSEFLNSVKFKSKNKTKEAVEPRTSHKQSQDKEYLKYYRDHHKENTEQEKKSKFFSSFSINKEKHLLEKIKGKYKQSDNEEETDPDCEEKRKPSKIPSSIKTEVDCVIRKGRSSYEKSDDKVENNTEKPNRIKPEIHLSKENIRIYKQSNSDGKTDSEYEAKTKRSTIFSSSNQNKINRLIKKIKKRYNESDDEIENDGGKSNILKYSEINSSDETEKRTKTLKPTNKKHSSVPEIENISLDVAKVPEKEEALLLDSKNSEQRKSPFSLKYKPKKGQRLKQFSNAHSKESNSTSEQDSDENYYYRRKYSRHRQGNKTERLRRYKKSYDTDSSCNHYERSHKENLNIDENYYDPLDGSYSSSEHERSNTKCSSQEVDGNDTDSDRKSRNCKRSERKQRTNKDDRYHRRFTSYDRSKTDRRRKEKYIRIGRSSVYSESEEGDRLEHLSHRNNSRPSVSPTRSVRH